MKFAKYQGLGNDFIILDKKIPVKEVIRLCDRKFGIGADGIIIHTIKNGLPFMDFYNADGTKAKMCGNGIRCYADYLDKLGMDYSKIDTLVGIKEIEKVDGLYKVSMGIPSIKFIDEKINNISINYLDSGTDHVVVYTSEKDMDTLKNMALEIQADKKLFPKGTNVNFVEIIDDKTISVITYERGVGFTLACGTGAVASAYLCKIKNLSKDKILVILKGGLLKVDIYENDVYMIGEARKVFEGEIDEQI